MSQKEESNLTFGASKAFEIKKAACGVRFCETSLDEETQFDFSNAVKLKSQVCRDTQDNEKAVK